MESKVRYELVPREKIRINDRFRRDYGDLKELAETIRDKGIIQSVTLDSNYNLLAGGRRMAAAEIVGLETIPCLIREVEGDVDSREVELMENIFRKDMTWNERAALVAEIDRLYKSKNKEWSGRKTAELIGKSTGGVNRQLQLAEALEAVPELAACKTEDEAFKMINKAGRNAEVRAARVEQSKRVQEVSILKHADGNFRVGDAFEGMRETLAVYEEYGTPSNIGLIEVDPPYGIALNEVKKGTDTYNEYQEVPFDEYEQWLNRLCHMLYDVAARDAWVVFWFGPTHFCIVKNALLAAGFAVDDIPAIWNKGNGQTNAPDIYLGRAYEPFFIARKGSPKLNKPGRSNVFNFPPLSPAAKWHPTQRPIPLMHDVLETFYQPGKVCMIPFLGSGAALAACYKLHMPAFGWDLSQQNKDHFMLMIEKEFSGVTIE